MVEALEVKLGSILAGGGKATFSVEVGSDGRVVIHVYVSSLSAPGRGILLTMRPDGLAGLERKIAEAREAIVTLERLR